MSRPPFVQENITLKLSPVFLLLGAGRGRDLPPLKPFLAMIIYLWTHQLCFINIFFICLMELSSWRLATVEAQPFQFFWNLGWLLQLSSGSELSSKLTDSDWLFLASHWMALLGKLPMNYTELNCTGCTKLNWMQLHSTEFHWLHCTAHQSTAVSEVNWTALTELSSTN